MLETWNLVTGQDRVAGVGRGLQSGQEGPLEAVSLS